MGDADRDRATFDHERLGADRVGEAPGLELGGPLIGAGEDDPELVAAQAPDQVGMAVLEVRVRATWIRTWSPAAWPNASLIAFRPLRSK